jgi:hypothetical protein
MAQLAINASPFQCRWISGTEMRLEQWMYAICLRCRDHPRVVSEDECGRCACWESPTGGASHVDFSRDDERRRNAKRERKRWQL